jgi:hypothetical protein
MLHPMLVLLKPPPVVTVAASSGLVNDPDRESLNTPPEYILMVELFPLPWAVALNDAAK